MISKNSWGSCFRDWKAAMPTTGIHIELLFAVPRNELFSRISALISAAQRVSVIVGFLTEEGVALIGDALAPQPGILSELVVGATTLKACDGLDRLQAMGVGADRLLI